MWLEKYKRGKFKLVQKYSNENDRKDIEETDKNNYYHFYKDYNVDRYLRRYNEYPVQYRLDVEDIKQAYPSTIGFKYEKKYWKGDKKIKEVDSDKKINDLYIESFRQCRHHG